MEKLIKNYIYNVAYQIFIMIVPFIMAPYLARTLLPENIGIFSYVTSCASIVGTIGGIGFYNYGDRQVAYTRNSLDKLNKTFNELVSLRLIFCVLSTIVYLIVAFTSEYKLYFLFYCPWLIAVLIDISWFFVGIEDMGSVILKSFLIKLFNVIFIFILVHNENDLGKYFLLTAMSTLVMHLVMYMQVDRKIIFSFSLKNSKRHFIGAVQLFLPQLASLFYLQIDKVMLKNLADSASQLAFYDQSEKIINIPLSIITALGGVMMPRIANEFKKGNSDTITDYIIKAFRFAMMLSAPILFGLDSIADNFIPWYLGERYLQVIKGIWILSPIIITNTITNISGTLYFTAVDRVKVLTYSNIVAAIMNIIVNAVLIPEFGFYGAAIATIFSGVSCVAIQLYSMNKVFKIVLLIQETWKYFAFAFIMFLALRLMGRCLSATIYSTILMMFIGILIYILLLIVSKDALFIKIYQEMKVIIRIKR